MATAADNTLLAKYVKEQVVKDRNYVGLNNWAAYTSTLPIDAPTDPWIKARIVAERFPAQPDSYVLRTLSYFLQDPATQTNIRQYLSAFNDEAQETALSAQVESVIGTFMPRFADIDVSDSQMEQWKTEHGIPVPPLTRSAESGASARPQ